MSIFKIIPTIPEVMDATVCFVTGHDWVKVKKGDQIIYVCSGCGVTK